MARKPVRRKGRAPWLGTMTKYEGFPLALRVRPDADTDANRKSYRRLAVVRHELAEVRPNGLPEDKYNRSLLDFDLDVIAHVERDGKGLVVLVETFAGKRAYYGYVSDKKSWTARMMKLKKKYPQHALNTTDKVDAEWGFYNSYRRDFPW